MWGRLPRLQIASVALLAIALALGVFILFLGWWSLSSNFGGDWQTEIKPFERGAGLDDETLTTGLFLLGADVLLLVAIVLELAPLIGRRVHSVFPAAAIILALGFGVGAIYYTMEEWPGNGARIDNHEVGFNDRVSQSTMFGTFWLEARPGPGWYLAFAAFGVTTAGLPLHFVRMWTSKKARSTIQELTANAPLIAIKRPKGTKDQGFRSR